MVEVESQIVEAHPTLRAVDGGSGEDADHFIEEAIAVPSEAVAVVEGGEVGVVDGAEPIGIWGFVAAVGCEGMEIMAADEAFKGRGKHIGVERLREVESEAGFEGGEDGEGAEIVVVDFADRGETGMKIWGGFLA